MPAQSQQQQKLFGLALSVKRGDTPRSEASEDVLGIVDSMSEKEIEDFASTKHKGLPKMKEQLRKIVREIMRERAISEITEGKKRYYQQDNIGKAKYTISYHDGKQKHKDGNDFFGIKLFKNKKDLAKFVNSLHKQGYVYGHYNESVIKEGVEPQIKKIAYYTGTRPEAVEDFVSKHALNFTKLLKYVEKGGLPQRMEFVSALAGRPNNPKQKKIIKQFQESVNEVAYNDAIAKFNKDLEKNSQVKKIASYYKKPTKMIVKALQPMITVLRYKDKSIKLVSIDFTDAPSGPTKVHMSQTYKQNESVNESAGCGCGCGCGGSKMNEEFKSKDNTFEKVYGIFDKKDYFNAKGLAKTQIGNFERALQRNDKGAQQILDKFKGDMDKAKEYIIQVISDQKKAQAFEDYKAFKVAVDSIQKGNPIHGAVDLVKSRIHNNSQKYTMALYSALRNQKFNKWKDIHADVDSLIGESVNEARFDRNKLMRIMKKYDDAMIYTADGNEFLIYSPYNNNKDNADMWHKNSVFALDKDATEHEIDYKDIVKIKG